MMSERQQMVKRYGLRLRMADNRPWGPWNWYSSKRDRDDDERRNRILAGMRTHTTEEMRPPEDTDD